METRELKELEKYKNTIDRIIIKKYNNGDKYIGEWKNDLKDGKGIYYYNNGDKYDGEYKTDLKDGKGIFYCNDGDKFEGE